MCGLLLSRWVSVETSGRYARFKVCESLKIDLDLAKRHCTLHWACRPGNGMSPRDLASGNGISPRDVALGMSPREWHFAKRSCTGHFALGQAFRQNGHFTKLGISPTSITAFGQEILHWAFRPGDGISPRDLAQGISPWDRHFAKMGISPTGITPCNGHFATRPCNGHFAL